MTDRDLAPDGPAFAPLPPGPAANPAVADPVAGTPGDDVFAAGPGGQTFFGGAIDFDILVSSGGFNEGLNAVLRIDGQTGELLGTIPTEGVPEVEGMPGTSLLNDPRDVLLDGPFGATTTNVLVNTGFAPPAEGNDRTLEFTQDGGFVGVFAELGASGLFVDPGGAVIGPEGDLFVGSRAQGTVFQFDGETGEFVPSEGIPTGGFFDPAEIDFPRGFVFDAAGDLFIGNGSNPATGEGEDNIFRVDGETRALEVFAAPEGFSPLDVILSADGESLVVSSEFPFTGGSLAAAAPGQIFVFDLATGDVTAIDPGLDEAGEPLLLAPRGLGIAPDGRLFASSTANGRLLGFDLAAGTFTEVFAEIDGLNGQGFAFVLPEGFDAAAEGIDTVSFAAVEGGVTASLATGVATFEAGGVAVQDILIGIENLEGTMDDDIIAGGEGPNTLTGGDGDDIFVSDGLDAIDGGEGTDLVVFADLAEGSTGGAFSGVIVDLDINSAGPSGEPSQTGGVLDAPPAAGGTTINDAVLTDIENVAGSAFDDGLFGNNEVNVLEGDLGDDLVHGFGGDDVLSGGGGIDTVLFSAAGAGVAVDLGAQVSAEDVGAIAAGEADPVIAATGGAGSDVLEGFENVTGSAFDDTITGDDGANRLVGGAGDDLIVGDTLGAAQAIEVTVTNPLPEGGTFVTPVWFGFHDGSFDLFDFGAPASPGLEAIAEDGTLEAIDAEFAAATGEGGVASAVFGFEGAGGPIDPGETARQTVILDPALVGPGFFAWATMVIPSNDAFLSSPDDPTLLAIFDENGDFAGPVTLTITGATVRDAGTEANTETEAAFLNQTAPDTGVEENGVVELHPGFNGSVGLPDATPVNILGGTTAPGAVIDPVIGDFTADPDAPLLTIEIALAGTLDDTLEGGEGADTLDGGAGADSLIGGAGADSLLGGAGDDRFVIEGADTVEGGAGADTVEVAAPITGVVIDAAEGGFEITFGGATSFVAGVERIELEDAAFAIDTSDLAEDVFVLFGFASGAFPDPGALAGTLGVIDGGTDLADVATLLAATNGLLDTAVDTLDFVEGLYTDGFGRAADEAGVAFWSGLLEDDALERGDVLLAFAQSAEAESLFSDLTDDGVLLLA